ncbi:NAD(P)/FAD-dependent oxidoreductase, partial [Pseudoalteromonas luteoviolacea]
QKTLVLKKFLAVEAGTYSKPKVGESIPPDTIKLFQRLGIAHDFILQNHEHCLGSYSCWGDSSLGFNDNVFNPHGHGWHLDRCRFDSFMALQFQKSGGELIENNRFDDVAVNQGALYPIQLSFVTGQDIRSRFVVDATGQSAKLARKFGAQVNTHDSMMSIAAYFNCEDTKLGENKLTLLEAVEYGWWYCAALPNNQLIVSLTSDANLLKAFRAKDPASWFSLLEQTQYVKSRTYGLRAPKRLNSWKTPSSILNPPAGSGWCAVGDAASCYDPISSQGIYKALSNGLQAAPAIIQWL